MLSPKITNSPVGRNRKKRMFIDNMMKAADKKDQPLTWWMYLEEN